MVKQNTSTIGIRKVLTTLRRNVPKTAGFTLIEVVVTLTILSFILLIIFGAFRLGLSAWERGESTKEEYQKWRMISQLISQQIKSTVPYKIKPQTAEGDFLAFEGKPHSLKFISALSLKAKQPEGFMYAVYQLKEAGSDGGRLILYEQRVLNKDPFVEEPKEELGVSLLEGISDVRFEYYRAEDPEKNWKEEWVEEWNAKEEKELPRVIKITIIQKDQKGKEEPSFIILASLPAYQWEEVRSGPRRRMIPRIRPRTGY